MKIIKTATDWNSIKYDLIKSSRKLSNFKDIKKIIDNIDKDITALSRLEVVFRQRSNKTSLIPYLEKINTDIDMTRDYILVATLIG
jgi:ribosomal 30S subunit maturation factor RimM